MTKKGRAELATCARCGNIDDLAVVTWRTYCLPCRTCQHGRVYYMVWEPPCWLCVRDLHTRMTFEGPRIRDVEKYARDATERWGLGYVDIVPYTFDEMCRVPSFEKARPSRIVVLEAPPHHMKSA